MESKENGWYRRVLRWLTDGEQKRRWLLLIGGVGVLLLVLSNRTPRRDVPSAETVTTEQYVQQTEQRLSKLVGSIEGAGRCRVLLTLDNGVEYVYATEERTASDSRDNAQSNDSERSAIVVDTGDGREGLLVTEIQPTVRGVVIVCEGGDNEAVRARVTEAVTVALQLSAKKVCVTKLK